ncbi:unnamed protein product [Porites lobata]|uniref:IRG-type G domain-containing protein n=1 Tax=Porites lobata TaxID=104759 RepID=A0ABN8Q2M8_9CNID|nr:unnamed protein product [Porites lobata]
MKLFVPFIMSDFLHGYETVDLTAKRLENGQGVEVNIAITGASGTGKSSFINTIRELDDDDDGAAPVGFLECTREPTPYDHPTNSNIKFWDLPGIGTPDYPDLDTYCNKVQLEKYHTYLIFTTTRFTANDFKLAQKVRLMNKKFFLIRTKIDENVQAEKRRKRTQKFDEEAMLARIRENVFVSLGNLLTDDQDIFLISNHDPDKWEFARLTQAILDSLTRYQRESMTFALGKVITRSSEDIFQRKVHVLRQRIWKVATASGAVAAIPVPGLSFAVDAALILRELSLYRSQLGLPEIGSAEFVQLHFATKEKVLSVTLTTAAQLSPYFASYAASTAIEEFARYIPFIGVAIASGISFSATYYALSKLLTNVEEVAKLFLKEAANVVD